MAGLTVVTASWRLVELVSRALQESERDAVLGDLVESRATGGSALRGVLSLVVRRQAALWKDWRPWLALLGLIAPAATMLTFATVALRGTFSLYSWIAWNYRDLDPALLRETHLALLPGLALFVYDSALTTCLAWTVGFVLGGLSRRTIWVTGTVFCAFLLFMIQFPTVPCVFQVLAVVPALAGMRLGVRRPRRGTVLWLVWGAAIATAILGHQNPWWWPTPIRSPWRIQVILLVRYWPIVYLVTDAISRRWSFFKETTCMSLKLVPIIVLAAAGAVDGQTIVRAVLKTSDERKPAPAFALRDASGKATKLEDYRGKVVLLDFWATWCHGCKEEIPWFSEFQKKYGKGFAVLGVSVDEDGWKVLKPFLAENKPGYRMVLGDQATAQRYGIQMLPDTFLIDKHGNVAAAYVGLVDRNDIEQNIRTLLTQR